MSKDINPETHPNQRRTINHERINPQRAIVGKQKIPEDRAISEAEELAFRREKEDIEREDDVYRFRKKGYAYLYRLIIYWLLFVAAIILLTVVLQACALPTVANSVLIALMTTTTASVLGIFTIAAMWLFPKK